MKKCCMIVLVLALLVPSLIVVPHAALSHAVNNLAAECEIVISAKCGEDAVFRDADFRQALGVTTYPDITILSLPDPATGVLKLGNLRVSAGQVIRRVDIGRMIFSPVSDFIKETSFTLRAGNLCGGATLTCTIRFTEDANAAPTGGDAGEACFFSTRKNASLWGTMAGYDPDGDDLAYLVVTYPENGTLRDVDMTSGNFRYTPRAGFSGTDSFSYVVRDSYGNYSAVSTVEITVDKHAWDLNISDVTEGAVADAACRMVSANIMAAERNGFAVYFHPNGTVTRAEFLVAAMKACGYMAEASEAWLYDDYESIPAMARPYVAAATDAGYLTPVWEAGFFFHPNEIITCQDAYAWLTAIAGEPLSGIDASLAMSDSPLSRGIAACLLLAASRA